MRYKVVPRKATLTRLNATCGFFPLGMHTVKLYNIFYSVFLPSCSVSDAVCRLPSLWSYNIWIAAVVWRQFQSLIIFVRLCASRHTLHAVQWHWAACAAVIPPEGFSTIFKFTFSFAWSYTHLHFASCGFQWFFHSYVHVLIWHPGECNGCPSGPGVSFSLLLVGSLVNNDWNSFSTKSTW